MEIVIRIFITVASHWEVSVFFFHNFSLEMLDKVEPPTIPEGYAMSVAFHCLLDLVRGITTMIEGELGEVETECLTNTTEAVSSPTQSSSEQQEFQSTSDQMDKEIGILL